MSPQELKEIIQIAIKDSTKFFWVYIVISVVLSGAIVFAVEFFKTKGSNLATKQDIEVITEKIEQVKANIQISQEIERQKRELKYNSLLSALNLIDAHLSNTLDDPNIVKQYATTEEARKCHNNLILSCDNSKVLDLFSEIMFGPKDKNTKQDPPTVLLNRFRNLVRKELGFGDELKLDEERAWFGKANFEKKE